ncbi:MAG: hypothetical protein N2483_02645 [Burkholderiaceae bacterium]|nr:hypothetical protein [Burkholderiaceae bacterium]
MDQKHVKGSGDMTYQVDPDTGLLAVYTPGGVLLRIYTPMEQLELLAAIVQAQAVAMRARMPMEIRRSPILHPVADPTA